MNVRRLIEKIKEIPYNEGFLVDTIKINKTWLLRELKQLELEKVTIPQFVADWIMHSKNIGRSLFGAMSIFEENTEIKKWM